MKGSAILLLLSLGLVFSCGTEPKSPETPSTAEQATQAPDQPDGEAETSPATLAEAPVDAPAEDGFDPNSISFEVFTAAKTDITALIENLNRIIRARNYSAWVTYLADSYLALISSRDFLEERTEELYRRDLVVANNLGRDPNTVEKRILRTARDYFNYVVVPSRANDRLDDISFFSESHIRVYTIDERRGQKLVLYDLVSIGNKWLIVH